MMEFSVDKSFYDSDLKELWDSDLEPVVNHVLNQEPILASEVSTQSSNSCNIQNIEDTISSKRRREEIEVNPGTQSCLSNENNFLNRENEQRSILFRDEIENGAAVSSARVEGSATGSTMRELEESSHCTSLGNDNSVDMQVCASQPGWSAQSAINEVFKTAADADLADWSGLLQATPSVILHDRLMTDAALGANLGATPIKAEHSYCSLGEDTDSSPDSELSLSARMDDMEDECYPCIPMKSATRTSRDSESSDQSSIVVKDEPLSEPSSPESSCPMSPQSPAPVYQKHKTIAHSSSTSHPQSLLKHPTVLVSRNNVLQQQSRVSVLPKLNIKVESGFSLPPTPPSSTTSDSEGNDHHPSSPSSRQSSQVNSRLLGSPPPSTSTRQPIQTSLISSQPKGSTGMLLLTEEEKRTLVAEGYPIPTRLPLTKAEEKSLKKIRRKIKNKISAQESRRKKKEYMDALERKVEILQSENSEYRKKIENLEDSNDSLISQLNKLQALLARASSGNASAIAAAAAAAATFNSRNSVRHSDSISHSFSRGSVK